jgi:hypothetical protein
LSLDIISDAIRKPIAVGKTMRKDRSSTGIFNILSANPGASEMRTNNTT